MIAPFLVKLHQFVELGLKLFRPGVRHFGLFSCGVKIQVGGGFGGIGGSFSRSFPLAAGIVVEITLGWHRFFEDRVLL